jgi:3-phenylpropionate/cinnamic acid dioxygenase small subunit
MTEDDRAELSALRARLSALEDRQAILDVVYRYARGLDRHDAEIYSSAYHEDAIDHHGDFLGRRDEFVPWGLGLLASEWDAHTHYITNIRVDIDGDVAHSECYVLFVQRRRDTGQLDIGGGRYIDRVERRDGEWRIAARELVVEWSAEASSTSFGGTEVYPHGTWDHSDPSYSRPFELPAPEGIAKP